MALSQNSLNTGANWSVMWLGKKGYMTEKKFGDEFDKALDTYVLLKQAGKKLVTLRSCNVGIPPPRSITHHIEEYYTVVRRRGKKYKKKNTRVVNLMERYNREGKWWCAYCHTLRQFRKTEDQSRVYMECPVCEVNNYNFYIRKYNPLAAILEQHRRTRNSGRTTRRTRKR